MYYSTSRKNLIHGFTFLMSLSFSFLLGAAQAEAQYQPLTGIPGVTDTNNITLVGYVNALFLLSIALGAMLAVVKIALAGFTYMMSDVVTKKDSAKEQIRGALIGLGILLATFVVLYTINPNLTNLDVLSGASRIELQSPTNPEDSTPADMNPCTTDPSSDACKAKQCQENGGEYVQIPGYFHECRMTKTDTGNSEATCDGYFEPHTKICYGTVQYIDLDPSFEDQPGQVRENECYRVGGKKYDFDTGRCILYEANN